MPANLPTKGKPVTGDEATGKSSHRATGVEGDGARGKISRGTWEAHLGGGRATPWEAAEPEGDDGEARSSEEAGNASGAKGL